MAKEINPDTWGSYRQDGDREEIENKERGCGYLKADSTYIRSDLGKHGSSDGTLPAFVILTDDEGDLHPIPYKESIPRGYETLNGTEMAIAAGNIRNFKPLHHGSFSNAKANMVDSQRTPYEFLGDIPETETQRHIDRLGFDGVSGGHFGEMNPLRAKDLMMRSGKSYYESPWDFIDECIELGLNKGISCHSNSPPPVINPGRTRCWIIHPHACGEDMPGIIGFAYLTRTIHTTDKDGGVPNYIQEYADSERLDVVDVGEPEPREDDEDREGEDIAETHTDLTNFSPHGEQDMEDMRVSASFDLSPDEATDLPKASLKELADAGWHQVNAPPESVDAVVNGGGIIAIVEQDGEMHRIKSSNNFSPVSPEHADVPFETDSIESASSGVSGPYTITVIDLGEGRVIEVKT